MLFTIKKLLNKVDPVDKKGLVGFWMERERRDKVMPNAWCLLTEFKSVPLVICRRMLPTSGIQPLRFQDGGLLVIKFAVLRKFYRGKIFKFEFFLRALFKLIFYENLFSVTH